MVLQTKIHIFVVTNLCSQPMHLTNMNRIVITLLLVLSIFTLNGKSRSFTAIDHIGISDGLSSSGVTSAIEDSRGYLWFGTYDGLNRYNGDNIFVYKNSRETRSLGSNRVRSLCEDSHGRIWIGTELGITIFDYDRNKFSQVSFDDSGLDPSKRVVRKMEYLESSDKVICFTEGSHILLFDANATLEKSIDSHCSAVLNDILSIDDNTFLLARSDGLFSYNATDDSIVQVTPFHSAEASALCLIGGNRIAVACGYGIRIISYYVPSSRNREQHVSFILDEKHSVIYRGFQFMSIFKDSHNRIWLGSKSQGLTVVNSLEQCKDSPEFTHSTARISCFLESSTGLVWASTYNNGVISHPVDGDSFSAIDIKGDEAVRIWTISEYDSDRVLFSENRKLTLFNVETNQNEPLPFTLPAGTRSLFKRVYLDSKGYLWLAANLPTRQMWCIVKGSKIIELNIKCLTENRQLPSVLHEDMYGNIWIVYNNKLYRVILDDKHRVIKVEELHNHPAFEGVKLSRVRCILSDKESNSIWVGTEANGLIEIVGIEAGELNAISINGYKHNPLVASSLPSNFITSLALTSKDELFIGTEQGGLSQLVGSGSDAHFLNYDEADGLPNNVIKSILYDGGSKLWIATNIGLALFDIESRHFFTYRRKDGLPFDEFTYPSTKMRNGKMIFAGNVGALQFDPRDIPEPRTLSNLQFGDLRINNELVSPNSKVGDDVILHRRLCEGDTIRLRHDQNLFSIEVEPLHFGNNDHHHIKYRLLPSNERWVVQSSDQTTISFNGLQPGDYIFQMSVSDIYGAWSKVQQLSIIIEPPFHKTLIAYVIYCVLFIIIISIAARLLFKWLQLRHKLEIGEVETRALKSSNEEKQRFFTNISHELKTPLTLISAPISSLSERLSGDKEVSSKLASIERQTRKMAQLVDYALGVQRDDFNLLLPRFNIFDLNTLMLRTSDDFSTVAEYDKKIFEVDAPAYPIFANADHNMIEKIVNNLLNNAFKYSRAGDTISIAWRAEGQNLMLTVADTGIGILPTDLPHIFERYFHGSSEANVNSTGIGLNFSKRLVELHLGGIEVDSKLDHGTLFSVTLPIISQSSGSDACSDGSEEEPKYMLEDFDDLSQQIGGKCFEAMVYIVDDNPEVRQLLEELISKMFNVKVFADGKACLAGIDKEWPDIIVSDLMMPEIDGYELCQIIKDDIKTSHIPFILLSAYSTEENKIKGLKYGADAYIAKPFSPKHLIARIESLLEYRKKLRERFRTDIPLSYIEERQDSKRDYRFLQELYNIINTNMGDEIDINQTARELGVNRTLFFQKIKTLTNKTPAELIKDYRLSRAAELLLEKGSSVSDVCIATGFNSRSNFSRLFKAKYGISPSKYCDQNSTIDETV